MCVLFALCIAIYVSSYCFMRVHTAIFVRILTIYVSAYYSICVRVLAIYVSFLPCALPDAKPHVLVLLIYMSAYVSILC